MSELRTKLLELAIQAGATIENAQRVAADWERWATEDDPLRVDTPSPAIEEDFYDQLARLDIDRTSIEPEIDWSRPQLVVSKYDDTMIVRTTGLHGFDEFEGFSDEDGDTPDWYKKKRFVYHGEIPQEQPSRPRTTGLNFLEAIKLLTDEEVVMKRASWDEDAGYLYSDGSHLRDEKDDPYYGNSIENFLATDWQIVKS